MCVASPFLLKITTFVFERFTLKHQFEQYVCSKSIIFCNPSCVSEKITMSSAYIRQSILLLLTFTEPEAFLKISGKSFKNNLNKFG
jgi:hypothetical protein